MKHPCLTRGPSDRPGLWLRGPLLAVVDPVPSASAAVVLPGVEPAVVDAVEEVDSLVVFAELDGTLILSMAVPIPSPPAASTMNAPTTAATTPTLDERRVAVFSSSVGDRKSTRLNSSN